MKKVVKKITAAVCILLMVFTVVEICGVFDNSVGVRQYTEEISLSEKNEELFNKIEQLELYAKDYKAANPSVEAKVSDLCLQFIRYSKYSGGSWDLLLGAVDQGFIDYIANEKDSSFKFDSNDKLYDLKTGKEIDLIHMSATLNCYNTHGETVAYIISAHFSGWAGDLLTFLTETIDYRQKNSITDLEELRSYVNKKLATNESSSFGSADALADLDAMNIYALDSLEDGFADTFRNYYQSNDEFGNNAYYRFDTIRSKYTSEEILSSQAFELLGKSLVASQILSNTEKTLYSARTENDMQIVSDAFAKYVFGGVYVSTSTTDLELKVGKSETFDIVEKNILEPDALRYDSDKISVSVNNFKMTVKALAYGSTKIEIYNGEDLLKSINVVVENVEPEVLEQPVVKKEYKSGENAEISFEAIGTNNKYRWYIYDSEKGTDTFLKETNEPKISLKLEESYNNKYLKCGIVNEGNTEVFIEPIKLVVKKADEPVQPEENIPSVPGDKEENEEKEDQTSDDSKENSDNSSSSEESNNKGQQNNKPSTNNKKEDVSNPNTSPGEDVKLDGVMNSKTSTVEESTKKSVAVLVIFFGSIIATIVFIILAKKNKETW